MNIRVLFLPLSVIVFLWVTIGLSKNNWDRYKTVRQEVVELTKSRDKLARGVNQIKRALTDYKSLDEETISYINNALPEKKKEEDLVAELNKNASRGGVLLTKITVNKAKRRRIIGCMPGKESNKKDKKTNGNCVVQPEVLQVKLNLFSSYLAAKNFLAKLDSENRVVLPVALQMTTDKNGQGTGEGFDGGSPDELINTNLRFNVFYKETEKRKLKFSQMLGNDKVLDSLLSKGLAKNIIVDLKKIINSQLFKPVQVGETGKEDLFKKSL